MSEWRPFEPCLENVDRAKQSAAPRKDRDVYAGDCNREDCVGYCYWCTPRRKP